MVKPDPELDELFTDPADRQVVDLLRAARPGEAPLEPYFRNYLRSRLMAEARRTLPAPAPRPRFNWRPMPALTGLAAVAAGFLIVIAGYRIYQSSLPAQAVRITTAVAGKKDVATAEPIKLTFTGPVDQAAVALEIQPATDYTTRWEGQTLIVIPSHPLAANTNYTVTVKPARAPVMSPVVSATPPPLPPVVVRFVTAPAPLAPVTPPSYRSLDLTFLGDSRIVGPSSFIDAGWTADGQLIVTRRPPAATRPAASASPSSEAVPDGSRAAAQEIWLVSPQGTFVRRLAAQAIDPAVGFQDGLFAFWRPAAGNGATLEYDTVGTTDETSTTVARIDGRPEGPPAWVGNDRLAYTSGGVLHLVDLHGTELLAPGSKVSGAVAASPDGRRLAVITADGPRIFDLAGSGPAVSVADGATGFRWSAGGDLAYIVPAGNASQLWIASRGGASPRLVVASADGEIWSDLNWSPDSSSLLLASRIAQSSGGSVPAHALLVNADGSDRRPLGYPGSEYSAPRWAPAGDLVLFTRLDETGRPALWTARLRAGALSAADKAQEPAVGEGKRVMDARLGGDEATARAQLGSDALSSYQSGSLILLSPRNAVFDRWYPVSVQLSGTDAFLVGVRLVLADPKTHQETSFFEEQLTVALHGAVYLIETVLAGPTIQLGHGPSVASVEVQADPPGQRILVHFDSDLASGTVTADTVFIRDGAGNPITPASFTFDEDTHLVTLKVKLRHGHYLLVVTTALADIKGQPLAQEYDSPIVIGD